MLQALAEQAKSIELPPTALNFFSAKKRKNYRFFHLNILFFLPRIEKTRFYISLIILLNLLTYRLWYYVKEHRLEPLLTPALR